MASYGENPRDAARQRLLMLMAARQADYNNQRRLAELEMEQARAMQEMQDQEGLGSWWGTAGQGAMTGGMIGGPIGAGIGAGAGLILGGLGEIQRRKAYAKATGRGGYGFGDAVKDTFLRAPTMGEVAPVMGGIGAAGAEFASDYATQREGERAAKMAYNRGVAESNRTASQTQELADAYARRRRGAPEPPAPGFSVGTGPHY